MFGRTSLIFFGTFLVLISMYLVFKGINFEETSFMTNLLVDKPTQDIQTSTMPTISPRPFVDLTINFLRQKDYLGRLERMEEVDSNVWYKSFLASYKSDGLLLNGLLTRPSDQMPLGGYPAIIFVHGYIAPDQYQTMKNYVSYVDYFARRGFVVFKIDLRGHADSEGEASGAYYSADYVADTLNAYAALLQADFVNPQKVGLWGHSMAGNIVMRALAVRPEIKAAVIWSGAVYTYTDLAEYSIQDTSYQPPPSDSPRQKRRQEITQTYGLPSSGDPFWQDVSPVKYLSELKGAIQIHHALDDNVVDIRYSRNLISLLDKTLVPHEFYEYQSGEHNLAGGSFSLAMQRSVEFFNRYLQH